VSRVIARIATIEHECGGLKIAVIHGRTAAVTPARRGIALLALTAIRASDAAATWARKSIRIRDGAAIGRPLGDEDATVSPPFVLWEEMETYRAVVTGRANGPTPAAVNLRHRQRSRPPTGRWPNQTRQQEGESNQHILKGASPLSTCEVGADSAPGRGMVGGRSLT
jgi:hypothetical protein